MKRKVGREWKRAGRERSEGGRGEEIEGGKQERREESGGREREIEGEWNEWREGEKLKEKGRKIEKRHRKTEGERD